MFRFFKTYKITVVVQVALIKNGNFAAILKINIKQKYCNWKYPIKILFKLALRKGDCLGKVTF